MSISFYKRAMSFKVSYAAEGDDISKCKEIDIEPEANFLSQKPDINYKHQSRDDDKKKSEPTVSFINAEDQMIIKSLPKSSPRRLDPAFELSSLPDSYDIKDEDSDYSSIPLSAVKFRRKSSDWSEELPAVATTIETRERLEEEVGVLKTDLDSILKELQCGIKKSLNRLPKYPKRDLLMTDFSNVEEIKICNEELCTDTSNAVLYAYAPVAFRFFRDLFDITSEDFMESVCEASLHFCSTSSRSGSMFFSTRDDRFILKTVPKKEVKFLMSLFPGYYLNLTQHTKTLLPKYYGLYFYVKDSKSIRVLIMNNILPRCYKFSEKYDIKGSTYSKRRMKDWEKSKDNDSIHNDALKDLDFLDRWPEGFYLDQEIHKILMKSIERDCKVLESYNIMDYSLLLGVVLPDDPHSPARVSNLKLSNTPDNLSKNSKLIGPFVARTMKGETVYLFLGIIDILQSFTWKRKLEYHMKSLIYRRGTISVNRPDFYSQRFQNFLRDSVFKCIPKLVPSSKRECCQVIEKGIL